MNEIPNTIEKKYVILFVEDDSTVCEVCEDYLTSNGFEVHVKT